MATYYVATLTKYVLVEAEDEPQARELGTVALQELFTELSSRLGRQVPIEIRTIRLATAEEIELGKFQAKMNAR
jgi:hypothetical protein